MRIIPLFAIPSRFGVGICSEPWKLTSSNPWWYKKQFMQLLIKQSFLSFYLSGQQYFLWYNLQKNKFNCWVNNKISNKYLITVHETWILNFCSNTRKTIPTGKHMRRKQLFYLPDFLMMSLPLKVCECFVSKADLYKDKECVFTCVVCLTKHACKGHHNRRIWLKRQN